MDKLKLLPTLKDNIDDILKAVKKENYDSILVLGFKEGRVFFSRSGYKDALELLGSIEYFKDCLLREMNKGK